MASITFTGPSSVNPGQTASETAVFDDTAFVAFVGAACKVGGYKPTIKNPETMLAAAIAAGWTKEQLPAVTPKMVAEAAGWSEEVLNPETPGQFAIRLGINLWAQLVDQARQQELQEIMQATHAAQSAQQDPLSKFQFQSQIEEE